MKNIRATRIVASTFGTMVGLAGINNGVFEVLQGNIPTNHLLIDAIGPAQRFWEYGTETALTIVPNMFVSGILSLLFGMFVINWSMFFIHRKSGAGIFMISAIKLFLVGGGFAPIFMSILAIFTATRIHSPAMRKRNPRINLVYNMLGKILGGTLSLFVVVFVFSVVIAFLVGR